MLKEKALVSIVAVLVFLSVGGLNSYGQCGIYFKRIKTFQFPVSTVHLNGLVDMTGDGVADLILSEQTGGLWTRNRIFILPGLGGGNFGPPATTITAPAGQILNYQFTTVKANGDNRPDLLIKIGDSGSSETFRIFMNNGDSTFTPGPLVSNGTYTSLVDVNNDGFGDHLSQTAGGTEFRYSLGNGDGTFAPSVVIVNHGGIPQSGDFNGDGNLDFIDSNHVHFNNGNMTWGTTDIASLLAGRAIWGLADFNVDGKLDVVLSSTSGSLSFDILTANGTSFTKATYTVSSDTSYSGIPWVGNWGGNSAPDIVFQPRNQHKKIVLINDGAGNFTQEPTYDGRLDNINGQQYIFGDLDNDGRLDRIIATSGITNSKVMLRDVTSLTIEKQVCDKPGQPRIVDYDRSNSTDWSFWNPATGDWSRRTIGVQGGPPPSEETINWGLGSFGDVPSPGDFDGDGVTDRAVYRDSTGVWYIRNSSNASWFVFPFGLPGDIPVVADYDGDSISDIAVWRPSDGNWHIWHMGPGQYTVIHFGSNGDKPVQADFDGDLKTDVAVYRPSTGAWYYYKSSDGTWVVAQWGISTDRPIPADFDGDGKADIAVHRESDRTAYILRSSTGQPSYYQFGLAGDILQVGDYDGDYVADLAMYRPSNRTWWTTIFGFGVSQNYGVDGAIPTSSLIKAQ